MKRLRARDVMTAPAVTVGPETPVVEVARILTERKISGVPVVDAAGCLVGIVTEGDLLFKEAGLSGLPSLAFALPARLNVISEHARRAEGQIAADVMTRRVLTAGEEAPVRELASLMAHSQINRIPIVDGERVVGIVSRNDVLKAFSRTDEELEVGVQETILHDLWIDPAPLQIRSRNGVVTISGEVDRQSQMHLIETFTRAIDGVAGVDVSGLSYDFDDRFLPQRMGAVERA